MNGKQKAKIAVDVLMTLALLFLMPYELIGEAVHEWIGAGMFLLFILHHILNRKWTGNLTKGNIHRTGSSRPLLAVLVLICILGSMISGIILSRYVFAFLDISGLSSPCQGDPYDLCLLGICSDVPPFRDPIGGSCWEWGKKIFQKPSRARTWILRLAGIAIAVYGLYAFVKRDILSYLLMQVQYVFFDFEEPVMFFILDYMAAMGVFVFIGYYLWKGLTAKRPGRKTK